MSYPAFVRTAVGLAASVVLALPAVSHADVSFNVGAVSDYRFRGISQTRLKPTLQAGVDYAVGGFYVGAWATGIKWITDAGGDADIEVDLYGGYRAEINADTSYDVGVLTYRYPSNKLSPSTNTTELYGALTHGVLTAKYSHATTNTFGSPRSKNSSYIEFAASFDAGNGFTVTPHVGYQKIKGPVSDQASYTDFSLTVSKDVEGATLSAALVGTDADKGFYSSPVNGKKLGKTGLVLAAKYNF